MTFGKRGMKKKTEDETHKNKSKNNERQMCSQIRIVKIIQL